MSTLFLVLYVAISLFIIIMMVRFLFDFIANVNRDWRPRGPGLVLAEVAYSVTDPPLKFVRRFVRPVRISDGASLDLAGMIVMLIAIVLSYVVLRFL